MAFRGMDAPGVRAVTRIYQPCFQERTGIGLIQWHFSHRRPGIKV